MLRGFHKYFFLFCCEFSGLLLSAVSFAIWKPPGGGIESLGGRRVENGFSIANFRASGPSEFPFRGNAHKNKLLQRVDGCDHTSTNAPDPIRTPQLSVLGRE